MLSRARATQMLAQLAAPGWAPAPQMQGRLSTIEGGLLIARGLDAPLGTQLAICDSSPSGSAGGDTTLAASAKGQATGPAGGRICLAEIIGFRGAETLATSLTPGARLAPGAIVTPLPGGSDVPVGEGLLGRILDPLGVPIDALGPVRAQASWPLRGKPLSPLRRGRVRTAFDCGVRAIDALLRLGRGQRTALIAGSGVGKSVLLGQILDGADADRIVIGLIGERGREISDFVETRLPPAVRAKSVLVAAPADMPPLLRLRAAERATAIAEYFRARGEHVLLLIDSLTRIAHAQREIGLSLGEPPAMKGYPPSVFALIPALAERAGVDSSSGGAITALYTVLADGDDVQDPVVDSARAIMDGHIVLSRSLAEANVYPAIDIGQSISRVMPDLADAGQLNAAACFRRLWSSYAENRDLVLMGAWKAGQDALLDAAIARRPEMLGFLAQAPEEKVPAAAAISALIDQFGDSE